MVWRLFRLAVATAILSAGPVVASELGNATQTICADGTSSLCSILPTDMNGHTPGTGYIPTTNGGGTGPGFNQTFADYFGWQSFVALNWPVDADGKPSSSKTIVTDTTSPRVWSTYATPEQVFGASVAGIENNTCQIEKGKMILFRTSKFEADNDLQASPALPLIDRYGNFVLYDIRMNDTDVQYLKANGLTTKDGQKKFGKTYNYTAGKGLNVGAIETKTSWRIMTDKDTWSNYYTVPAVIIVPKKYSENDKEMCINATVGLVGMHIMQKFTNPALFSEFWLWATFEHKLNSPLADGAKTSLVGPDAIPTLAPPECNKKPDHNDRTTYSFYDTRCYAGRSVCPVNTPPKASGKIFKWAASSPFAYNYMTTGLAGRFGTQVVRCFKIYPDAEMVTGNYQAKLGNSAFSNYMLVGAQWATGIYSEGPPLNELKPFPAPVYLTNTASETYIQTQQVLNPGQFGPGSCINCHYGATDAANNNSNSSFLPSNAH